MRFPPPLKKGDTIGVCAPSSGVPQTHYARLDNAHRNVRAFGYQTVELPPLRNRDRLVSADAATRARGFMALYEDPAVAAIIPPWGGEFLMDMLPQLDFDRIARLPPKWIAGYSDITTLTFALTLLCDTATIHGSNFLNMGAEAIDLSDAAVFEAMRGGPLVQKSAPQVMKFASYENSDAPVYAPVGESRWELLSGEMSVRFTGRVIGGCMDVICKLIGTPYAPVSDFLRKYKGDRFIWTLESCEMSAADVYRTLWQMRACGWFDGCAGVLVGRPDGFSDVRGYGLLDALRDSFAGLDAPVVYGCDIGHVPPQMQFVNGAVAAVAVGDGKATVEQSYRA